MWIKQTKTPIKGNSSFLATSHSHRRLLCIIEKMASKVFVLALVACCQVATAQQPTVLPNPLGGIATPFNPLGAFNANWVRPYYSAAAEGWRTYFDQLQQARNQLYQTLTTLQNTAQNGDLQAPAVEAPAQHDVLQETQIIQTVKRPQGQSDPMVRPQGQVTVTHTVTQTQPNGRQPQTVGLQGVNAAARPVVGGVAGGVASPQRIPQVGTQVVPQVGAQVVPQLGGQVVPQVGGQVPAWVGK